MGLASWALGRIRKPLGVGFKVGKLIVNCVQTGPRPLRITEKVAIFLIGQKKGNAALALYVVKIICGKVISGRRAEQALTILSDHTSCDHGLVEHGDVVLALQSTQFLFTDSKVTDARAGFFFVQILMEKQAIDSRITGRYRTQGGFFDAAACLRDFYGSSKAYKLIREVRKLGPEAGQNGKRVLAPIVERTWHENCVSLRNDAIDFLLL
ncbi:hypothetical protein DUNSADRAFT_15324 [Dunaliella salina]|uniref:Uncharacterized protein n=1 Tax=Dunaliella salina TaxID=3046 RepID=A0ABQ7G5Q0_DUNSA|nr:hypothetical protein DUNSADRAFT_15324 [Dunaliella salina]|eukprot:KAF5829901.1 hypothetical protein DUNSADRAFT_15324 [Dunaliella salina]